MSRSRKHSASTVVNEATAAAQIVPELPSSPTDGADSSTLDEAHERRRNSSGHIDFHHHKDSTAQAAGLVDLIDAERRRHSTHEVMFDAERSRMHEQQQLDGKGVPMHRPHSYSKKAGPIYSLAQAKGAPKLDSGVPNGARIGLAHGFHGKAQEPDPSHAHSARNTPRVSREDSRTDLLEAIRSMIAEEVRKANIGHTEELKRAADLVEPSRRSMDGIHEKGASLREGSSTHSFDVHDPRILARGPDSDMDENDIVFPNKLARLRYRFREPLAEFLGCFILILFGNGINCQVFVSALYDPDSAKGNYLSVSFGWGVAVMLAVYVSGGVSGGLLNPALTIALAIFRGFSWRKVPAYIFAQISGATLGALCIYGLYVNPIRVVDPAQTETTASLFTTYPAEFLRTPSTRMTCFYNEVIATMVLLLVVLAIGDVNNTPPVTGMAPFVLLWLIWGLGATLGWQTAYAVNPARDLGPRIALSITGYRGLWTFNAWYWLWTPTLAPIVGAILGGLVYDTLIYTGGDSPMNKPWRYGRIAMLRGSKEKMPAGLDRDVSKEA